jgi:hypothetical protein
VSDVDITIRFTVALQQGTAEAKDPKNNSQ